jgi:hypothetical protein
MGRTPTGRPPGAPAKPIERKRRVGNPGKRPLPTDVVVLPRADESIEPPRPLVAAGLQLWERVWAAGSAWISSATDIEAVLILCEQMDERSALRARVIRSNDWRERSALRALDAQVMAGLSALGFTPSDRARMGVGEVGEVDELEALRRRHRAG